MECTCCGDGVINGRPGAETCDGGDAATCNQPCTSDCSCCGDGIPDPGEFCDDGDSDDTNACRNDCTTCGDNIINGGETCDGTDDAACPGQCQPDCICPRGGEGCTPGYWKLVDGNSNGASHQCNWTDPYDPDDLFCGVFDCSGAGSEFAGFSLIDVLEQPKSIKPSQLRNLGFHAVAALLNAASPDVSFGLSVGEVIDGFNDALADFTASGDKADLAAAHSLFSNFNNCGAETCDEDDPHCCPLGNCTCSNTQDKCSEGSDCAVGPCPASSCVDGIITQSLELFGGDQVACAAQGLGTTQNAWARCYDLAAEGIGNTTINSVTFGVFQFEGNALSITVDVNLYLDDNGCPPPGPGSAGPGDPSLTLIGSESVIINALSVGTLITVPFPGVGVLAGSSLIVEIENDADGTLPLEFFFRTEANGAGECGPSYLRAAPCGIPGWIALGAIGFPDLHLLQVVNGTTDCDPLHTCGGRNQGGSDCCTEDTLRSGCDDGQCQGQVCAGRPSCCDDSATGALGVWDDECARLAGDLCCAFLCEPLPVTSGGAQKSSDSDIGGLDLVAEDADTRFSLGVADFADDDDTASSSAPSVGGCGAVGMVSLFVFIVGLIGLRSTRTRQQ